MKKLLFLFVFCFAFVRGLEAQKYDLVFPDIDGDGISGPLYVGELYDFNLFVSPETGGIKRFNYSYYRCDTICMPEGHKFYRFGEGGARILGARYIFPAPGFVYIDGVTNTDYNVSSGVEVRYKKQINPPALIVGQSLKKGINYNFNGFLRNTTDTIRFLSVFRMTGGGVGNQGERTKGGNKTFSGPGYYIVSVRLSGTTEVVELVEITATEALTTPNNDISQFNLRLRNSLVMNQTLYLDGPDISGVRYSITQMSTGQVIQMGLVEQEVFLPTIEPGVYVLLLENKNEFKPFKFQVIDR